MRKDFIHYTPKNAEAFFAQLERWNDEDEYTRCIRALTAIPEELRDYRVSYALARALENYAIIGDHDKGTPNFKGGESSPAGHPSSGVRPEGRAGQGGVEHADGLCISVSLRSGGKGHPLRQTVGGA